MTSLNDLFVNLQLMERTHDLSPEITAEMVDEHFSAIGEIDQKVDRLLGYMDNCKAQAALYAERAEQLTEASKLWEKDLETLKKYCFYLLDRYPDVEFRGTDRQISKKKNSVASLVVPLARKFSTANLISDEFISSVPESYRESKKIWVLKNDVIKSDLEAGKQLDFAQLNYKENLMIKAKLKADKSK